MREKSEREEGRWRRKREMKRVEVRGRKGEKERGDKKSMIGKRKGKGRWEGREGKEMEGKRVRDWTG